MPNFAVLQNNLVINIIVADSLEDAEMVTGLTCIEYSPDKPVAVGFIHDGTNFEFPALEPTPKAADA
jgi:hypothetical protein